jgi:DNA-binding MarR family transcriptional regulator
VPVGGHVNVALQVFRTSHLLGQALDDALEPTDLDGDEFAVLSVLRVVQPVGSHALAEILKMPPASLTTRLGKLERRRLVRRRRETSPGRPSSFELTAAGERKVDACYPIFGDFIRTVEGSLGDRLRAVQDALADLERALEKLAAPAPARRASARTSPKSSA